MSIPSTELSLVNPWMHLASFHLQRTARAMAAFLAKRLDELDLRLSEATILCMIDRNPGITQSDISSLITTRRPNISPITRTLHRRALIEREQLAGKRQGLVVTAKGAAMSRQINAIVDEQEELMLSLIPADIRQGLAAGLEKCGIEIIARIGGSLPE